MYSKNVKKHTKAFASDLSNLESERPAMAYYHQQNTKL